MQLIRSLGWSLIFVVGLCAPAVAQQEPAAEPTADGAPQMDAGTHGVRVRDLDQRVDQLGRDIFRSRVALEMLQQRYLDDPFGIAQTTIRHENGMGPFYRLVGATYALDGRPVFRRLDASGDIGRLDGFDVYAGGIPLGEHVLSVRLDYVGDGRGLFPYLEGYRFTIRSSHSFTAPSTGRLELRVRTTERGGPLSDMRERPAIEYAEEISR